MSSGAAFPQAWIHRNSHHLRWSSDRQHPVRVCCAGCHHQLPGCAFGVHTEPVQPLGWNLYNGRVAEALPLLCSDSRCRRCARAERTGIISRSEFPRRAWKCCHGGERGVGVGRSQLPEGRTGSSGGGSSSKAALAGNPGNLCCPGLRAFLGETDGLWRRVELLCEQSGFPCTAWEGRG